MKAIVSAMPVTALTFQGHGWLEALGQWLREPAPEEAAPLFDATTSDTIRLAAFARAAWLRGH